MVPVSASADTCSTLGGARPPEAAAREARLARQQASTERCMASGLLRSLRSLEVTLLLSRD